ncbi:MAG: hypothetical protein JNG83_07360 [Opitutaceae bacterium]|nr:hypothetical protein [Opitutaceae bacterium]
MILSPVPPAPSSLHPRSRLAARAGAILAAGLLAAVAARGVAAEPESAARPFRLETTVDFADDVTSSGRPLTVQDIDALMAKLAAMGIKRVCWSYYGDGRGGYLVPKGYREDYQGEWDNYEATYRGLGNPLKVAVEAGHRHGLEVYAYFKPYETGPGYVFPEGSPEAREWGLLDHRGGRMPWLDPFVRDHPELRIRRRTDDVRPADATAPVRTIKLTKQDAGPTRITEDDLQIWTSPNNYRYQPTRVRFTLTDTVEPARRDVRDQRGRLLTRQGDPVRVLTLSGLDLQDKYILVTTTFKDGAPDFVNSGLELMQALDESGREIPGVFATGGAIAFAPSNDFRRAGLMYDHGFGAAAVALDAPNTNGRRGLIAFTRGRNEYLPGALCETEPAVQRFWLGCLEEMIAAGVDGVDFREENHSTHTDYPHEYGFNAVVLEQARVRPGDLLANIAAVRGEAYTEFLRQCKRRLGQAGKRMRYNLQLDFFRPHPPAERLLAYPLNVHFDWRRWVDEGLMDEAVLRFFSYPPAAVFDDPIAQEMIARCQARGLPVTVNRYVAQGFAGSQVKAELLRFRADGRFAGFNFYEVYEYLKFGPRPGEIEISAPAVAEAAAAGR